MASEVKVVMSSIGTFVGTVKGNFRTGTFVLEYPAQLVLVTNEENKQSHIPLMLGTEKIEFINLQNFAVFDAPEQLASAYKKMRAVMSGILPADEAVLKNITERSN